MAKLVLRPGSCLASLQAAGKCMLSHGFGEKRHPEARQALLKGDLVRAARIASAGKAPWNHFVMACCEWHKGRWMRVVGHTTQGLKFPPEGPVERHYQSLLERIEADFADNVPNIVAATPKPTLSACLIVRDEEDVLERCLASIKPICDEIVVVDTGSKDATVQIAEKMGARVSHFEWVDDFAAARNFALQQATGDWILSIDADEWLDEGSRHPVRVCMTDPSCFFVALTKGTNGQQSFANSRLFPRANARWRGALHEDLDVTGLDMMGVHVAAFVFHHVGYTEEVMEAKGKAGRNKRLIEKMIARGGEEARLGEVYDALHASGHASDEEAIEKLSKLVNEDPSTSRLKRIAYRALATKLIANGRYQEALDLAEKAEKRGKHGLWSYHIAALIAYHGGDRKLAIKMANLGLAARDYEGSVEQCRRDLEAIKAGTL